MLFLLFLTTSAISQDYKVVNNHLPAMYSITPSFQDDLFKAFETDSVEIIGPDSLFYTFAAIRDTTEPGWGICLDSEAGSIMGRKILQQNNRTVLFNYRQDSIFISRNSIPGKSWHYYNFSNGDYIEAAHQQTEGMDILGTSDSVKVIVLIRKDADGNVMEDNINGKEILLSRNYGLVQTFDNYLFPDQLLACRIVGFTNPTTGLANLEAKGVYDFNVGDEFHFKTEDIFETYDQEDSVYKIISGDIIQKIRYVTGRADYADSVVYHYSECSKIVQYTGGVPDTSYKTETVAETIIFDSIRPGILNAYPDQKIRFDDLGTYYRIGFWQPIQYNGFPTKIIVDHAYMDADSCVIHSVFDPCCYSELYIKSCGGPYFNWSDWTGNVDKAELVYFNKNGIEWGEPVAKDCDDLLSDINGQSVQNADISVYPNPFSDQLIIASNLNSSRIVQIKLLDINGRILKSAAWSDNRYTFNTGDLSGGIYILEIQFENGYQIRRKVVKSRD